VLNGFSSKSAEFCYEPLAETIGPEPSNLILFSARVSLIFFS